MSSVEAAAAGRWSGWRRVGCALCLGAMLATLGPAQAAGEKAGSSFDDIRALKAESDARNAELSKRVEEISTMLEEMKRLAFEIDLRIARIKNGEFDRDCDKAVTELASIDSGLSRIASMEADARARCDELRADNAAGKKICADRLDELTSRRDDYAQSRQLLLMACPMIEPKAEKVEEPAAGKVEGEGKP